MIISVSLRARKSAQLWGTALEGFLPYLVDNLSGFPVSTISNEFWKLIKILSWGMKQLTYKTQTASLVNGLQIPADNRISKKYCLNSK